MDDEDDDGACMTRVIRVKRVVADGGRVRVPVDVDRRHAGLDAAAARAVSTPAIIARITPT